MEREMDCVGGSLEDCLEPELPASPDSLPALLDFNCQSPDDMMKMLLKYIDDCRYLAAFDLYTFVKESLSHGGESRPGLTDSWKTSAQQLLDQHIEKIENLLERTQEIQQALNYQDQEDQWILGAQMLGVTTYYQLDSSDDSMIIKMEGESDDLPLFEQCVVIHEVDLFHTWIPFCAESKMVTKISKAELIPYINIGIPPLSRDFCLHTFAADCLQECGKLVIVGKSVETFEGVELPLKSTGWFHKRMVVKEFKTIVDVKTSTQAKTVIFAHIHPNAPLPQSFINFIMKNLAGLILYLFNKQVQNISRDPTSEYWSRIEKNAPFYKGWVLPKLREFCDFKGWEQPSIACLGEAGQPPATSGNKTNVDEETRKEEMVVAEHLPLV